MSVALVTGGSRGIGRVICQRLAQAGYDVATCYSGNEEAALETVKLIEQYGVKGRAYKANVVNQEEVETLFATVKEELGVVEVLVNNAGVTRDGLLIRMTGDDFDTVIDTNLKGTFYCTKEAVKEMMRKKTGRIINITSVVGLMGNAGQTNYAASKAGIIGFTKSVAKEYGQRGIRVNAVAPGFIATAMTDELPEETKKKYLEQIPAKRFGAAEDVAKVVEFLAGDLSEYITGQTISVDGGMYM